MTFMAVWFPHSWFSGILKRCGQMLATDNILLLQQLLCRLALYVPSNPNCDVCICTTLPLEAEEHTIVLAVLHDIRMCVRACGGLL